jgi:hypothetical protein
MEQARMTRIRTHNKRAKRRERKDRLGFLLPSQWRLYQHQGRVRHRGPIFFGMDLGRESASVVWGRNRFGKTFELLRSRFTEGKLILHPDLQQPDPLNSEEIVRAHNAGTLSEGQASRMLNVDRITLREMADAMRNLEP